MVERQETEFYRGERGKEEVLITTTRWRFAGNIRYHINTLAGISDRPVELLASLVWPRSCRNEDDFFATPAINITCLEDFVVEFNDYDETIVDPRTGELYDINLYDGCFGEPQLQIVAVLTSTAPTAGQEILYSARYRTTTRNVSEGTIGTNPFDNMSLEEISERCTNEIPRPVSGIGLSMFCTSRYKPEFGKSILGEEVVVDRSPLEEISEASKFAVFPNPFVSQLTVEIKEEWLNLPLQFQLHDALGRKMWESKPETTVGKEYVIDDDLSHLPSGTYLLTVSGKDFVKSLTIQKQ